MIRDNPPTWNSPRQLRELRDFYTRLEASPETITDAEVLAAVAGSFWGTNCWSYAEAGFAIIGPACALRPHLARELLRHPVGALVAGAAIGPEVALELGLLVAADGPDVYVRPLPLGRKWLLEELPGLLPVIREIFAEIESNPPD